MFLVSATSSYQNCGIESDSLLEYYWFSLPWMRRRHLLLILISSAAVMAGYWLAGTSVPSLAGRRFYNESASALGRRVTFDASAPKLSEAASVPELGRDDEAVAAGALPGQRILVFRDREAMERFLKRAGEQVRVIGRLDALNALRVGVGNSKDLSALSDGDAQASFVFPVETPPAPTEGKVQPGAVALGAGLLDWLGITGDNSAWGKGVRIAILDTGVAASSAFANPVTAVNLVDLPADLSKQDGHGTAVASVILGQNSLTPGVAPGAEVISIRIANDLGQSDSFLLAKGIVAAVDAGAQLINISMGSFGDSVLVKNAIEYARTAGALIFAAVGNQGSDRVSYPAADDGVIAVGAVDALGDHLDFSNTGNQVAISAPGFGVNAAWTQDQAVRVSGTSFSSPIVAGAVAALMSQPGSVRLSPQKALGMLTASLNDGGEAGNDPALGAGMPDLGRVLSAETRGIYDAAVASQRILPPSAGYPYGQIEVLVQNRGTERLVNTMVSISSEAGVVNSNITSLPINAAQTILVPIQQPVTEGMSYSSQVKLSGGLTDAKPANDRRRSEKLDTGAE